MYTFKLLLVTENTDFIRKIEEITKGYELELHCLTEIPDSTATANLAAFSLVLIDLLTQEATRLSDKLGQIGEDHVFLVESTHQQIHFHSLERSAPMQIGEAITAAAFGNLFRLLHQHHQQEKKIRELDSKLRHTLKVVQSKEEEFEQFTFIASHNLQEHLLTATSFLDLIEKENKHQFSERSLMYLDHISQACNRTKTMLKDLLDYLRIGKNQPVEEINCNLLLEAALSELAPLIDQKNAHISVGDLPMLLAYPDELGMLFKHLLSNALKFVDTNPIIQIEIQEEEHNWTFSVKDNGIGIEAGYLNKIFYIFQRLHARESYPGNGIGLALCKKIALLHNGKIWVKSQAGIGSTFYVTISKQQTYDSKN